MYCRRVLLCVCALCAFGSISTLAQSANGLAATDSSQVGCVRVAEGSVVPEPEDLRSRNGVLEVELAFRTYRIANGQMRYCYVAKDGSQAPNLRLHPGDTLILRLKNEASILGGADRQGVGRQGMKGATSPASAKTPNARGLSARNACEGGPMIASATNLHFHGLRIPASCHQDETLKTLIEPSDAPFEYRFQIPANQPPGLYWYHPHVHGFSKTQILGGASGALIVEGIESSNRQLAGLPERVFVIRDQDLLYPNAAPPKSIYPESIQRLDAEGDVLNTGTGTGKPAKDLSINFVNVPYPNYPPAVVLMKPSERQLWRVLNASAITYLNLQLLFDSSPQPIAVVALDGAPLNENGNPANAMQRVSHAVVPPGGRVEFVVDAPRPGVHAVLVTRGVDTGPAGENDPLRALATIAAAADAAEPQSTLAANPAPLAPRNLVWLGKATPVRERKLYFSEKAENPNDPNSPTTFYITVEGQTPAAFDPKWSVPNIVAQLGTVEDWVIENRSQEFHAFHIHQTHFILMEWNGRPVDEPFLRDTVNLDYWDGKSPRYPSVKLRIDFRDPNIAGTFAYHCHLLEHQDGGMMGIIRVDASRQPAAAAIEPVKSGKRSSTVSSIPGPPPVSSAAKFFRLEAPHFQCQQF
jgi:FtsP/CotA-like multicopper oxidase with cupredoxin domain